MILEKVFVFLLNMSITASYVILAVMLLRLCLKKAPKWISCALWALVGLRLIFPFSIESVLSLIPSAKTVTTDILYSTVTTIGSDIPTVNSTSNSSLSESLSQTVRASVNPIQIAIYVATLIWIAGFTGMIVYSVITYVKLRKKVSFSIPVQGNIYQCDRIVSPFVLGIVKPKIYLPFTIDESSANNVVAHEKAHIRRKDHWIKPLGFLLLTMYWFNPLVWVAYVLFCRDIELACDEAVIREIGSDKKKKYAKAMLECSVNRRSIAMCPVAFGEIGVKQRVKNILNFRQATFWIVAVALFSCVMATVCLMTNPLTVDSKNVSSVSTISENNTALEETRIRLLADESINCMINIFELSSLTTQGEPIKDNIYQVDESKFKDYAAFENYIRSLYYKTEADRLLNDCHYENDPKYLNIDGKLCINMNQAGAKGYYVDWKNYEVKITNSDDTTCDFTLIATVEWPSENPTKESYTVNASAVYENGNWLLKKMFS